MSFPSPGDLPNHGSNPLLLSLLHWQVSSFVTNTPSASGSNFLTMLLHRKALQDLPLPSLWSISLCERGGCDAAFLVELPDDAGIAGSNPDFE